MAGVVFDDGDEQIESGRHGCSWWRSARRVDSSVVDWG